MEKITKICENNFDVSFIVKQKHKQIKKNRNEYKIFLADETKFSRTHLTKPLSAAGGIRSEIISLRTNELFSDITSAPST